MASFSQMARLACAALIEHHGRKANGKWYPAKRQNLILINETQRETANDLTKTASLFFLLGLRAQSTRLLIQTGFAAICILFL